VNGLADVALMACAVAVRTVAFSESTVVGTAVTAQLVMPFVVLVFEIAAPAEMLVAGSATA
jgi:hypothetical protein